MNNSTYSGSRESDGRLDRRGADGREVKGISMLIYIYILAHISDVNE